MDILITMAYTAFMTFVMVKVTEYVPTEKKQQIQVFTNQRKGGGGNKAAAAFLTGSALCSMLQHGFMKGRKNVSGIDYNTHIAVHRARE